MLVGYSTFVAEYNGHIYLKIPTMKLIVQ